MYTQGTHFAIDCICYERLSVEIPEAICNHAQINQHPEIQYLFVLLGWSSRILGRTSLKPILEFSGNTLHMTHTSSTGGLPSLGFLAPVVCESR
jgi:hypothetical protein